MVQPSLGIDAMYVPLPESPNESLTEQPLGVAASAVEVGKAEAPALPRPDAAMGSDGSDMEALSPKLGSLLLSPVHRSPPRADTAPKPKPISPEKAALAAMFDSIKMPPPTSPTKSPRKASGSSLLTSPSKQLARNAPPTALSLFRKKSSPSTSPRKAESLDVAASRPHSADSPSRRSVFSSPSPRESATHPNKRGGTKTSSLLSPAGATSSQPTRRRPSTFAASSSPSAKLSDLSLTLDATGTQELLFHQDASFLVAAANTAADVTIDDSFDVSRAKAHISASSASARRSSPAKVSGYRPKPRCSMVAEEGGAVDSTPNKLRTKSNALGLRGLGIGRVVKNAAGDDTIELNLTGSFIGNSSVAGGNLMDESGEASLLFGNDSFSISHGQLHKEAGIAAEQKDGKGRARRGSSEGDDDDDDDNDEEDNFERDTQNVQKWAAEAAKKAQLGRQALEKAPGRLLAPAAKTAGSTSMQARVSSSASTKLASRGTAPRPSTSLVTPTASRLLKPRASAIGGVKPESAATPLARSGSASASLASLASPVPSEVGGAAALQMQGLEMAGEMKTPMRSRRKSTFTSSRPPVSGPARRRESLAAAAVVQAHPLPAVPPLAPATPGRVRTVSNTAPASPNMKTPTAATRTVPKPRASLTGRTTSVLPKPRGSTVGAGTNSGSGSIPRPRTSLTSSSSTTTRTPVFSSAACSTTPGARAPTNRSASLATPTARTPTFRPAAADVTPGAMGAMRKSTSQPHGLDLNAGVGQTSTTAVPHRARTLVPRASMSRIGTTPASATATTAAAPGTRTSQLATPRATVVHQRTVARAETLTELPRNTPVATAGTASKVGATASKRPPSMGGRAPTSGGFGFKPRTSAVYVGVSRPPPSLMDGEDKEN